MKRDFRRGLLSYFLLVVFFLVVFFFAAFFFIGIFISPPMGEETIHKVHSQSRFLWEQVAVMIAVRC